MTELSPRHYPPRHRTCFQTPATHGNLTLGERWFTQSVVSPSRVYGTFPGGPAYFSNTANVVTQEFSWKVLFSPSCLPGLRLLLFPRGFPHGFSNPYQLTEARCSLKRDSPQSCLTDFSERRFLPRPRTGFQALLSGARGWATDLSNRRAVSQS